MKITEQEIESFRHGGHVRVDGMFDAKELAEITDWVDRVDNLGLR